jgi:hypothetical protein
MNRIKDYNITTTANGRKKLTIKCPNKRYPIDDFGDYIFYGRQDQIDWFEKQLIDADENHWPPYNLVKYFLKVINQYRKNEFIRENAPYFDNIRIVVTRKVDKPPITDKKVREIIAAGARAREERRREKARLEKFKEVIRARQARERCKGLS